MTTGVHKESGKAGRESRQKAEAAMQSVKITTSDLTSENSEYRVPDEIEIMGDGRAEAWHHSDPKPDLVLSYPTLNDLVKAYGLPGNTVSHRYEQAVDELVRAEVCRVLDNPDPDGHEVQIKAAYRDLSCKGTGPECYRRVRYPGKSEEEWPDCDRLPRRDTGAGSRRATVYCRVPVGTLVVDFERTVLGFRGGRCTVTIGVAIEHPHTGKPHIVWCEHRTLRSRPVFEVTLPNGTKTEVSRREFVPRS